MAGRAWLFLAVLGGLSTLLATLPAGCGDKPFELPRPGPGIIFSYPFAGQMDVPTRARVVLTFTDAIDPEVLNQPCTGTPPSIQGGVCVVGPSGVVAGTLTALGGTEENGDRDTIVHFQADEYEPGATYSVFVSPSLLASREPPTNIPDSGPLFSFRAAHDQTRSNEPPVVWAVNGRPPETPGLPFMDFTTVRVLVSEALDPDSVRLGDTVAFVELSGTDEVPVPGTLLAGGPHITFDPDADLVPGRSYRLRLTSGIRDAGGEALADQELDFTPYDSRTDDGQEVVQVLNTQPAIGDDGFPAVSTTLGDTINSIRVVSQLVGETSIDVRDANLEATMANPALFEETIPLTIRKGQALISTGLDVRLGGEIPANLQTGDVTVSFISDVTGYVIRNPYRPPDTYPDDAESPLLVYLSFDAGVSAKDALGNAVLNQNLYGVQVVGAALVRDGALFIEAAGSIELDLLGVARAPANLVFTVATTPPETLAPVDAQAPTLLAAHPFDGQDDFPPTTSIRLIFDEPVSAADGDIELLQANGVPVDILVRPEGSTLVVTPRAGPLAYGAGYSVRINAARDLSGNPARTDAADAAGGDGLIEFSTPVLSTTNQTPPLLTSLYPGVPCVLVDASAESPGRCAGGLAGDDTYAPFTLPANRPIVATFDKPMNRNTMTLGATCGTGSVRVEALDEAGSCIGPVPGTLMKRERGFRFEPDQRWQVGQRYRLTLGTGTNNSCDGEELCGLNGRPLNPDPLNGSEDGEGGGPTPTLIIEFTADPATEDTFVPAATSPFSDVNGSGFMETGEVARFENYAAMRVIDTTGVIPGVGFEPDDCVPGTPEEEGCTYVGASLPVSMEAARESCTVGEDADGDPIVVARCVPARLFPQVIYGTSVRMRLLGIVTINTGRVVMRMREAIDQPSRGYVIEDPATGAPVLRATLSAYMDAPDMSIPLAGHDLESKEITLSISGPVEFADDGRMRISASNDQAVQVTVAIDFIGLGLGTMTIEIPVGAMSLQLMSEPAVGTQR